MRPSAPLNLLALAGLVVSLACGGVVEEARKAASRRPSAPWSGEGDLRVVLHCEGSCASDAAVIHHRLSALRVEHDVMDAGPSSMEIELHYVGDVSQLMPGLLKQGRLGFHGEQPPGADVETRSGCVPDSDPCQPISWTAEAAMGNREITRAWPDWDVTNNPVIMVELSPEGRAIFKGLSAENVGRHLVVVLDEEVLMMPVVMEAIDSDTVQINLGGQRPELAQTQLMVAAMTQPPLAGHWTLSSLEAL